MPCYRCCRDDDVCRFSLTRKRHVLRGAVHKQTDQILYDNESFKAGVVELYKRVISGRGLEDSVHDVQVNTNITTILDSVGVLGQDKDAASTAYVFPGILESRAESLPTLKRLIQPAITPDSNVSEEPSRLMPSANLFPQAASRSRTFTYHSPGSAAAMTKPRPSASFEPTARLTNLNDGTAHTSIYPPPSSPWLRPACGPPIPDYMPPTCGPPITDLVYSMSDAPTTSGWVRPDSGGGGGSERGPPPAPMVTGSHHYPYYTATLWPQDFQGQEYPPQWEWPFPSSQP
ncbi:hypothetical protein A1O7_07042 [Cladophialophora yegresii CBS 114405]|uniref:Uncharacterized protein n=1 Tax=Cladophialophora yegresii CBS 114405 TaxID=1182544 RepID=W9VME3_9EURO|nr:uncharacterized protein A1O7_07042 [Cladophialophora yegresii CBS 114405]EXJ56698.1 hypothetical protein A1O7_07042 [Cladophialophora yegresii CBS 114405]